MWKEAGAWLCLLTTVLKLVTIPLPDPAPSFFTSPLLPSPYSHLKMLQDSSSGGLRRLGPARDRPGARVARREAVALPGGPSCPARGVLKGI